MSAEVSPVTHLAKSEMNDYRKLLEWGKVGAVCTFSMVEHTHKAQTLGSSVSARLHESSLLRQQIPRSELERGLGAVRAAGRCRQRMRSPSLPVHGQRRFCKHAGRIPTEEQALRLTLSLVTCVAPG